MSSFSLCVKQTESRDFALLPRVVFVADAAGRTVRRNNFKKREGRCTP
jgi:hypothetical protein